MRAARGQWFNAPALTFLWRAVWHSATRRGGWGLLVPWHYEAGQTFSRALVQRVAARAREDGRCVRAIVLDKDNTLTEPYADDLASEEVRQGVQACADLGGGIEHVWVLSNSAGSADDVGFAEVNRLETLRGGAATPPLGGATIMRHGSKKPSEECLAETLRQISLRVPDAEASNICLIGDRLLTDIVFGNSAGMLTVLVEPLAPAKNNFSVKCVVAIERLLLRFTSR